MLSLLDDDRPPDAYIIRHEKLGYGKKVWSVRENIGEKKVVTAFGSKKEASGWIYRREMEDGRYSKVN